MIGIIDMVPPYLVFFAIYAASLNPVLLLCIVISFVPSIVTLYMQRNIFYSYEDTAAPVRRKYQGYRKCLTDLAFIKETRVLRAVPFFFGKDENRTEAAVWKRGGSPYKGERLVPSPDGRDDWVSGRGADFSGERFKGKHLGRCICGSILCVKFVI